MAYQPYYSPYPQTTGGYYTPPMQDQLAQLRQPYQQPAPQAMQQPVPQPQAQTGISSRQMQAESLRSRCMIS